MSEAPRPTIRKFNPGVFQSDQEVLDQFVVRSRELEAVLEVLRGNIDAPSCQHTLVVAPRGRGKTMLLARVAAELRTDSTLRQALVPVRFMEESLEVFTIGDFWLEALSYLAKECVVRHPELARELEETHAALVREWRDSGIADRARVALLDASDRLGAKLVLMVENLQGLTEDVDRDFGWQLRQSLQTDPEIMLLGTATSRFEGLDDAREPFFELFRILNLDPLNTEECQRLWEVVSGDSRDEREIRALEILTGGSPRLLVIVAEFARHRSLPQMMEELVTLIDDHTEYFRGHIEALPKTERRVYLAVADLWQASSTREVSDRARLDVRKTSALLGRLVGRGAVTADGSGRSRRYAVSEPLYCIYYKLRRQRDETAVVRGLIRFMVAFYARKELASLFGTLMADVDRLPALWDAFLPVAREDVDISEIAPGMADATYRRLLKRDGSSADPESTARVAANLIEVGSRLGLAGEHELSLEYNEAVIRHFESVPECQFSVAVAFFGRALAKQNMGETHEALASFGEMLGRYGHSAVPDFDVGIGMALLNKGFLHGRLNEPEAAIASYEECVRRFGKAAEPGLRVSVAVSLLNKGSTLARDAMDAALATWDHLIEAFADDEIPDVRLQVAGAFAKKAGAAVWTGVEEDAISTCDEAVRRYGTESHVEIRREIALALEFKGVAQNRLGRAREALQTCDLLIERFGDIADRQGIPMRWRVMGIRTQAMVLEGDEPGALRGFREICRGLDPANDAMVHKVVWDTIGLVAIGLAPDDLAEVLAEARRPSDSLLPLLAALRKIAGDPMRVSEEVSKVAEDVIQQIALRRSELEDGGHKEMLRSSAEISPEEFERAALRVLRAAWGEDSEEITLDRRERVKGAGGQYEIDGVLRIRRFGGAEIVVFVECKRHGRRLGRDHVMAFEAKIRDCGAHKGILIASSGFQSGAIEFAQSRGIATATITDGRLNYETFGLGSSPTARPGTGWPRWEIFVHSVSDQGGIVWSLANEARPDDLREWLLSDP
ncbi:restriction endonuclease [Candidatus Palauibacter sp.]|uniref:restriction endonuclease n=1 Tax=Candidatus Palauibacter sp. TaxID=3101350 RepID=UPI003B5AA583